MTNKYMIVNSQLMCLNVGFFKWLNISFPDTSFLYQSKGIFLLLFHSNTRNFIPGARNVRFELILGH